MILTRVPQGMGIKVDFSLQSCSLVLPEVCCPGLLAADRFFTFEVARLYYSLAYQLFIVIIYGDDLDRAFPSSLDLFSNSLQ